MDDGLHARHLRFQLSVVGAVEREVKTQLSLGRLRVVEHALVGGVALFERRDKGQLSVAERGLHHEVALLASPLYVLELPLEKSNQSVAARRLSRPPRRAHRRSNKGNHLVEDGLDDVKLVGRAFQEGLSSIHVEQSKTTLFSEPFDLRDATLEKPVALDLGEKPILT